MERPVVAGRRKHIAADDTSPQKKIKVEREDSVEEDEEEDPSGEFSHPVPWKKIEAEGLDCDYAQLFSKKEGDHLFKMLEEEIVYAIGTTIKQTTQKQMFRKQNDLCLCPFQGKKPRCWCLGRCTTSRESRLRTETQVLHIPTLELHG